MSRSLRLRALILDIIVGFILATVAFALFFFAALMFFSGTSGAKT